MRQNLGRQHFKRVEEIFLGESSIVDVEELEELLNPMKVPNFEAQARTGQGVFDTLKAVSKLVLTELKRGG